MIWKINDLSKALNKGKYFVKQRYSPPGYNLGMNCGEDASPTVMHFHCHIIPRYKGAMGNPRGGIRHCVQGKGYY
jgi:diadenosine tetraphosphate (Ap4A) HIT family hydrolase